jgi:hypothetical protein
MDRLSALDPEDAITRDLVARADAALKAGHLDETDRFLSQAEQAEVAAARQAQEVVRQAQAAADQRLLRAAAAAAVRGNIAMTKLQYLDAVQHFQDAVDRVPAGHPDQIRLFEHRGKRLRNLGAAEVSEHRRGGDPHR